MRAARASKSYDTSFAERILAVLKTRWSCRNRQNPVKYRPSKLDGSITRRVTP
jgi:hypothetical protein